MKSAVPDNIKIKSCFKVNLFENFILKYFINKYKPLENTTHKRCRSTLHQWGKRRSENR
jgi:hypothetical protein